MSDLLDVDTFREHYKTSLGDDAIQRFIDAEDALLLARLGPIGTITDVRFPRGESVILLGRTPVSVVSVTEKAYLVERVLDPLDYLLVRSTFYRLDTGPHPPNYYTDRITIVYTAVDDVAVRVMAMINLVGLDVLEKDAGAVRSRTVGQHAVTYATPEERQKAREAIWASLQAPLTPFFA